MQLTWKDSLTATPRGSRSRSCLGAHCLPRWPMGFLTNWPQVRMCRGATRSTRRRQWRGDRAPKRPVAGQERFWALRRWADSAPVAHSLTPCPPRTCWRNCHRESSRFCSLVGVSMTRVASSGSLTGRGLVVLQVKSQRSRLLFVDFPILDVEGRDVNTPSLLVEDMGPLLSERDANESRLRVWSLVVHFPARPGDGWMAAVHRSRRDEPRPLHEIDAHGDRLFVALERFRLHATALDAIHSVFSRRSTQSAHPARQHSRSASEVRRFAVPFGPKHLPLPRTRALPPCCLRQ